jgi:hypothetical protein
MVEIVSTCNLEALKPGLDVLRPRIQGYITYVDEYVVRGVRDSAWARLARLFSRVDAPAVNFP